ncbi:MAG: hypothetical protein R3F11_24865 [Verrucomicrobiales bacterium]
MREAQGSVLTNKYAEGCSYSPLAGGCENVDVAEDLAIDRAKELFSARISPTCSRTPAARRTRRFTFRCSIRAIRF